MTSLEAIFIRVENDAFHAVVERLSSLAKRRPELRFLELAEFSPPHPWLRLTVPRDDIPDTARRISEGLGCRVVGLVQENESYSAWLFDAGQDNSVEIREQADAIFRAHDLPRFSDHRLRIGPAWPFRRWEWFW